MTYIYRYIEFLKIDWIEILYLIFLTFGLSFFITYFLVPFAKKIGLYYKFLDFPDSRKTHKKPIVRIGGLAIILGWIFSILFIYLISFNAL